MISHSELAYYITTAYTFHGNQKRKDGITPYFLHPVAVAHKLFQVGIDDDEMIKAALFHDVLEDTDVSEDVLRSCIGDIAFGYVKALTCTGDKKEYLSALCQGCIRPLVIKVADRLCNIHDFAIDGDSYAPVYYRKTEPIFDSFRLRRKEVEAVFGEKAYDRLDYQIYEIGEMVK